MKNLSVVLVVMGFMMGCSGGSLDYADAPPPDQVPTLDAPGLDTSVAEGPSSAPTSESTLPLPTSTTSAAASAPSTTTGAPSAPVDTAATPSGSSVATAGPVTKSLLSYLPADADTVAYAKVQVVQAELQNNVALGVDEPQEILNKVPAGTSEIAAAMRIVREPPRTTERTTESTTRDTTDTTAEEDPFKPEYGAFVLRKGNGDYSETEVKAFLDLLTRTGETTEGRETLRPAITQHMVENMIVYDFLQDHDFVRLALAAPGTLLLVRSEQQAVVENYHRRPPLTATSPLVQQSAQLPKDLFMIARLSDVLLKDTTVETFVSKLVARAPILSTYLREGVTVAVGAELAASKTIALRMWHGNTSGLSLDASMENSMFQIVTALFAETRTESQTTTDARTTDTTDTRSPEESTTTPRTATPEQELMNISR